MVEVGKTSRTFFKLPDIVTNVVVDVSLSGQVIEPEDRKKTLQAPALEQKYVEFNIF